MSRKKDILASSINVSKEENEETTLNHKETENEEFEKTLKYDDKELEEDIYKALNEYNEEEYEVPSECNEEEIEEKNEIEDEESLENKEYDENLRGEYISGQSSVTSYLKEMVDCKVVPREEEIRMFKALKDGDESMVESIFKANARLVPFVVKKFSGVIATNPAMDFEDLISAGNIGLLKAIGFFDPEKGYKFSTYAYHWICSFAERAIRNEANLIRIPVHIQDKVRNFKKVEKKMEADLNRELTYEERVNLAKKTLGKTSDLSMVEQYDRYVSPISLNKVANDDDDEGTEFGNLIANDQDMPEEIAFSNKLREEVLEAIDTCLPKRNAQILKLRFGFENGKCMTLEEVGNVFGLTRERIRQIESKSIQILRRSRRFRHLKDYMEIS